MEILEREKGGDGSAVAGSSRLLETPGLGSASPRVTCNRFLAGCDEFVKKFPIVSRAPALTVAFVSHTQVVKGSALVSHAG